LVLFSSSFSAALAPFEIIYVNDGSTDATAAHAREGGAEVIVHPVNLGKGESIKSGMRHWLAREAIEFIILLDADGQHLPDEIGRFLAAATSTDAGLFVGTRMNDVREMPFVRRTVNRYMSRRISRLCGQDVPDTQCGYRMVQRALARHRSALANPLAIAAALGGRELAAILGLQGPDRFDVLRIPADGNRG
jgi:glycosyltransferase involved in cell wall biosynthesis